MRKLLPRIVFYSFLFTLWTFYGHSQTANFTAPVTSGCSPLVVNFQDQSTGNITSWLWDFGNGATATLQNPSTTYFTPGVYNVKLMVKNAQGTNTLVRNQYIVVYGKPAISFNVSDSIGCFPLRAQFTDNSTPYPGTTNNKWLWDFGDGTQSTMQNPLNIYTNSGTYSVTLKLTNDQGCYSVLTKQAYIKVSDGVRSSFTNTQPVVCKPPFSISFTNNSTGSGVISYLWDFGDGSTSTLKNPVHNFTGPGNFNISLATTSNLGCTDTARIANGLKIDSVATSFSAPDSVCVNSLINFQNTSTPAPVSSSWQFGDGTTSSAINPVKSYSNVITYNVKLYNSYSGCTDSFSKNIKILPRPVAKFTADSTFKCQPPFTVHFSDLSSNAVSWQWDFGDGTTSTLQNPVHTFTYYNVFPIQLIVTNSSGCTDTIFNSSYIKIIDPSISFGNLPVSGCVPYTINPVAFSGIDPVTSYMWDFGDGTTSTAANPSHTYAIQGTYTVSVTITTKTGCTKAYSLPSAVTVGTKPTANFYAVPTQACAFQSVKFIDTSTAVPNGINQWIWDFGDGTSSNVQNPLHKYQDTGIFNVKLIVSNNGCRDSLSVNNYIKIKPPIAKFGLQPSCSNRLLFNFLDSSIGATGWVWDFGDGTTSTLQNPSHTFPSLGNYNVTLTVSNDTCSHSKTTIVKVINEAPDFQATKTVMCRVGITQLFVTKVNSANISNYHWDYGNGGSIDGYPAVDVTYDVSGAYTPTLITTDIYGCMDTVKKINYILIKGPLAQFNLLNNIGCKGITTTFTDASKKDSISNIVNWTWDFGDSTVQSFNKGGTITHVYNKSGTFDTRLIITDAAGCKDSISKVGFVQTSAPKANFTADSMSCPNKTVQFTNTSVANNFTSSWTFGDGNSSTTTSPGNFYTSSGLYTVKLVITDKNNCSDSLVKPKYIRIAQPVASFKMNDSISSCIPLEVDFTNTSQYYISSRWDLGGGTSSVTNPIQYYVAPGVYPIRLLVTSPGGCMDSAFNKVQVFDTVGSKVTYLPLNGCKPLSVDLNTFSPGPVTYTWDFGDGTLIKNNITSMNHIYNFFGNFVPKVIMTDPSGCIIPITGKDTIKIIGATAKFGLDNRFFCDSGFVSFLDSTTNNDSLVMYQWNFGDGTGSGLQSPGHFYSSPGLYTVSLNVKTEKNCVDTFTLNNVVKVVASPLVRIGGDSVICINDYIRSSGIFARSDTSQVQWAWDFPNGANSNQQNPVNQQYNSAGNFVIRTIVTNSSGCKDTAYKNIIVYPLPVITLPSPVTKTVGIPVTLSATYSPNVVSYSWQPVKDLSCTDCPQPVTSTKFDTKYLVTVTDSNGCRSSAEVQVIVTCKNGNVFVPNTFSPNGDGVNDIFYVRGRGLERVKMLRIFNRWGQVVFEQSNFPVNDPAFGWNGKFKGNKPQADVYIYQVEVFCENGQIIRFEGNVALIL